MDTNGNSNNASSFVSGMNGSGMINNAGEDESAIFGMPTSPGSLMGSSIRSNQVHSFDIESESCSITGENPGWRLGMPWFSSKYNNHNRDLRTTDNHADDVNRYYGGIMKTSGETSAPSPNSVTSNNSRHFQFRKSNKRKGNANNVNGATSTSGKSAHWNDKRNERSSPDNKSANNTSNNAIHGNDSTSFPIVRTKSSTADSIADFDDSEWTPPDSSYGAACPVCGFIPKRVRQMIEMTLIAAMVFFLIYLLVTTSMKIADAHRKEGSENASSTAPVVTDDDVYVEKYSTGDDAVVVDDNYVQNIDDAFVNDNYNNDDQYATDDDGSGAYTNGQNYNYDFNNQNYNYYSRNRRYYLYTDDYNYGGGGRRRRQLRRLRDRDGQEGGDMQSVGRILNRIHRLFSAKSESVLAHPRRLSPPSHANR
eukprot:jgi/Psemu1/289875/fgenesh1_pg.413_\